MVFHKQAIIKNFPIRKNMCFCMLKGGGNSIRKPMKLFPEIGVLLHKALVLLLSSPLFKKY